jgi:hypothetical protein
MVVRVRACPVLASYDHNRMCYSRECVVPRYDHNLASAQDLKVRSTLSWAARTVP